MDKNADKMKDMQFAWTVPGWPLEQMLWDRQTPERRLRIERALKNGNLVTHALPYTTHTGTLELEDLVRGLGYSSSLARTYGLPLPTDGKMTDVPGGIPGFYRPFYTMPESSSFISVPIRPTAW